MDRIPRTICPLHAEYRHVGHVLTYCDIYQMSEHMFVSCLMEKSGGGMNSVRVKEIYKQLMEEAGLPPLENK